MARRPGTPTPLAELLDQAQAESARRGGAALTPNAWQAVVGDRIAARTRVGRLQRGTLTVYVGSSAWANELTFLMDDILSRLRTTGLQVRQLRFQVKDLGLPADVGNARPGEAPRATKPPPRAPLPPALLRRLARVEDPDLREAIAEAAALSLADPRLRR